MEVGTNEPRSMDARLMQIRIPEKTDQIRYSTSKLIKYLNPLVTSGTIKISKNINVHVIKQNFKEAYSGRPNKAYRFQQLSCSDGF